MKSSCESRPKAPAVIRSRLRSDNLTLNEPGKQEINLTSGGIREAVWHAHVISPKSPWVAVVIPDGTLSERREVTGREVQTSSSDATQRR